jgi:hypothetical protein
MKFWEYLNMELRPLLAVVVLFTFSVVAAPALAQTDYSEFMVDGKFTKEQAEIVKKMEDIHRHKAKFKKKYIGERLQKKFPNPSKANPKELSGAMERLRGESEEAYKDEHADKVKQLEAYEKKLEAIANGDDDADEGDAPSEQDLEDIFDDVDAEIAVYSRQHKKVTKNDGHMILEDGRYVVEFCYADSGCEDRSVDDKMSAGRKEQIIHKSDPDKEVVGLRLRLKVHPRSAATASVFVATGETSDAFGNPFEKEDILFETDPYEPGDTVTYELGETD